MISDTAAYSTEAHQLALYAGASPPDLEYLSSREALLSILTDANIEQDICEDVCDTCELSNLNALTIASGLLTPEQIAQFCFLTKDEAEVVFSHCSHKAFHAGVTFGRADVPAPVRLGTFRRSPKAADAAAPRAFSPKDGNSNSGPFGGDSLKFDSPSKRGHRERPAAEFTGPSQPVVPAAHSQIVAKDSANLIVQSHDQFSPKHASDVAANNAFDTNAEVISTAAATAEQAPTNIDITCEPQPDNLAGTGVSTTSSSAPSTIPTPSVASTKSINRITPLSFDAADTSKEVGPGSSDPMPGVSAPASAATAAPSPLPAASEHTDFSVPPSELVAPAAQGAEIPPAGKNQSAVPVPKVGTETGPNSPQTPREATAREMLKVESCQLNTGSTVPPQHDSNTGNAVATPATSALPSPTAVTPGAVSAIRVLHGASEQYAANAPLFDPAPTPPRSAPDGANGRRSAPTQPETATSMLAADVMSALPTPMRTPRPRPPPPQINTNLKSPRTGTPSRGRQGRPQTAPSTYPQEGLDELGSTFLKYPGVLPSFMRPTAAHERRLNAADDDSREGGTRTPSPPRRQARSVNPTARFIQPTASYSAKATPATPTPSTRTPMARAHSARAHSAAPTSMRSHTPTSFAPFCLHTEMRLPQRNRKTTDEMRVAEAKKAKDAEVLRRRQQLQRMQKLERARTASPKLSEASTPAARSRNVKPFQLASVMRHEREVQNRKQQLQRQLQEEARAKQFRARQFNPAMFAGVQPRVRRSEPGRNSSCGPRSAGGGRPVTAPKAVGDRPGHRHNYRQEILESEFNNDASVVRRAVQAREDERKQEAAQAARERDFKSKMGKPGAAFRLDVAKVKPTTIPKPFKLSSSKVIPSLYSDRDRNGPPTQLCTPQGVMTEFARSLRAARGEQ